MLKSQLSLLHRTKQKINEKELIKKISEQKKSKIQSMKAVQ